jgi:putative membrane protein
VSTPPLAARSPLSDGEWHRPHPLTPLLRGGLFLVVVVGVVIANLRDRLVDIFLPWFLPDEDAERPRDPLDYILSHDLVLLALLAVLGAVLVLVALFWLSWRFHTFRITGDDVEVRSGVVFRTHRRAPLDRVQGVNLTRPLVARLLGLAKLEVVGAGLDANVRLEYLSTPAAEAVRADILQLASGRELGAAATSAAGTRTWAGGAADTIAHGVTGIVMGVEEPAEPESVVRIPPGRLIGSVVLSSTTIVMLAAVAAMIVGASVGTPWILIGLFPAVLAFGAYTVRSVTRALRYAIAPTDHGVRIVFGLFTTVTEILPPGRVHAVQVRQPLLWRRAGWWTITINRLSGTRSGQQASEAFTKVLPVGTRADAERVVDLLLPWLSAEQRDLVFARGVLAEPGDDPFTTTPAARWFLRPVSWRRNGFRMTPDALFLRRGRILRSLAIVPLARMQSIAVHQGPIERMLEVATVRAHTVTGTVYTGIGAIDRLDALALFAEAEEGAIASSARDRTHRWYAATLGQEPEREQEPGRELGQEPDGGATDVPVVAVTPETPVTPEHPESVDLTSPGRTETR